MVARVGGVALSTLMWRNAIVSKIASVGRPGAGKTLMARAMPSMFPSMSIDEAIEVTKIYSVSGLLPADTPLIRQRPFRVPHHAISHAGLVGGGLAPPWRDQPGPVDAGLVGAVAMVFGADGTTDLIQHLTGPVLLRGLTPPFDKKRLRAHSMDVVGPVRQPDCRLRVRAQLPKLGIDQRLGRAMPSLFTLRARVHTANWFGLINR